MDLFRVALFNVVGNWQNNYGQYSFNTNKYKIHNGWDAINVGYCGCKNLQYLISLSDNTWRKYKILGYICSF